DLVDGRHTLVLSLTEPRIQPLHAATGADDGREPHGRARAEDVRANRVAGLVLTPGVGSEAEEVLLRVVAVRRPSLELQPVARQFWEREPRLGRPIQPRAGRGPHIDDRVFVERVAVAVAGAVREAAAGRQRSELWVEPVPASEENAFLFDEMHRALEASRL